MRFNAKDFFATALVAAITAVYIAYLQDSSGWIISSTRSTTAVVAVLGISACAMGRVEDLYVRDRSLTMAVVATWASLLGIIAVIAVVVALVTGDSAALATLFIVTVALWVTATVRHALTVLGEPTFQTADSPEPADAGQQIETPREPDVPAAVQHRPDATHLGQRRRSTVRH